MREYEGLVIPTVTNETVGTRIRAERIRNGYSVRDLADATFVTEQAIGKWQKGTSLPSVENLVTLSYLFGVSVDYLLVGRDFAPAEGDREPGLSDERAA